MRSKRYIESKKKIDINKTYNIEESIKLIKESSNLNFDETLEISIRLNTKKQKEQFKIRATLELPYLKTKKKKILAIIDETAGSEEEIKKAGALEVGSDTLINRIAKDKKAAYNIVVTTPAMMPKIAKIAKILGPKGLMPNPKTGTISKDIIPLIKKLSKRNRVEFKSDKDGNIHSPLGKVSQKSEELVKNVQVFIGEVKKLKPETWKGEYMSKVAVSGTMGPSILVS